jgi:CubicO group peptidase (beta-lactamase class C family)
MKLRPEDMAKLGLLYLNNGDWEGESLISSTWVEEATSPHVDTFTTPSGYGYQWWTNTEEGVEMFLAVGYGGNLIAVVPDRDLVAVIASDFDVSDPLANAEKFNEGEAITMLQSVILAQPD